MPRPEPDSGKPLVLRPKPLVLWHLVLYGLSTGPRDKGDEGPTVRDRRGGLRKRGLWESG